MPKKRKAAKTAGRRLSLILESSLASNQRHVQQQQQQQQQQQHPPQENRQWGTNGHRRSVSFREGRAQDVPGHEVNDGYDQYEQIDKSQRTQVTADWSESSVPALIVIGNSSGANGAHGGGGGGGGGGSSSVSSFQSALTADTLQVVPVGGSNVLRVDVDLDAPAAGAAAPTAPADRRETMVRHRTSVGPAGLVARGAAAEGGGREEKRKSGSGSGFGGGFGVPSARELLRRAEARMLAGGSSRRGSNGRINPTTNWTNQQGDGAECEANRRMSSRRSMPADYDCTGMGPSQPLPTSANPLRASTSQPNLTRLAHHYAAQDPGFRKRFSDFVRDQLSGASTGGDDGGGGGDESNNAEAALAERIRRVGSYGNSLDQLRGYYDESAGGGHSNIDADGSAEMAQLMLNGGYGVPAHRRGTDQPHHHHHHNNHVQRIDADGGKQITPLPTDSRVTTIKLDNILVQICNTQLTHFLRLERHYRWLSSFRRLDPRYQILTFFNDVSREGGENVDQLHKLQSMRNLNPLLRGFVKASAFSVWRPTSHDAIYKMMRGEAVGKGLDVKGKSARRGVLSGYIPFVQIHTEDDKRRMRRPPKDGRVRVYYQSEEARDAARKELTLFAAHASHAVRKARLVIEAGEDAVTEDLWERALKYEMILDVEDSMIYPLDGFSEQGRFGLDVAERYFVEVSIANRDISRPSGSELDVGRNSEPAFQDMNSACIRAFDGEMNRAVILQMDDSAHADPLQPQTLVVAYEEHGRVIPVASDFDAFLVGTRGVDFSDPLPPEQVDMMADMIEEINNILSSPATDSWTVRWLDFLKMKASKNNKKNATPQYGYGDPKSYDMMEAVARRLEGANGAVRHGPECFNLVFPQEIDDSYLIVCDSLPGKVPWKYVDAHELQEILCDRIDDGFALPLNPKWVLCDPGWKRVWDKLMASDDLMIQQSIDMWYPPSSGIRERIEEICREHPNGFQRQLSSNISLRGSLRRSIDNSRNDDDDNSAPFEGTEAMDLAEQELKYYMIKKRAKMKLKAALMFRKLRSSSTPQNEPKAPLSLLQTEDETLPVACKAVSILAGCW